MIRILPSQSKSETNERFHTKYTNTRDLISLINGQVPTPQTTKYVRAV